MVCMNDTSRPEAGRELPSKSSATLGALLALHVITCFVSSCFECMHSFMHGLLDLASAFLALISIVVRSERTDHGF